METEEKSKGEEEKKKTDEPPRFLAKYDAISEGFESFFRLANLGDLNAIYRNRGCYAAETSQAALTEPVLRVFHEFPAARPAIYSYTGVLVHECVHFWFNQKENVAQTTSVTIIQEATFEILDFYSKHFGDGSGKGSLEEILTWLCELFAELSLKNAGRPAMSSDILSVMKSNEVVEKLLALMNVIVTTALQENPDGCMKALFEASRHGEHFNWIWLHIATILQGAIITPLLECGSDQFKIYVAELALRKTSGPAVLNIIQTEYEHKFRAISEVFNFLMCKRNPELQEAVSEMILESLDDQNRLGFAFFFKLITCSLKTLQILVNNNGHLRVSVTPFNVIRAIRHVQAIEKTIILPTLTYLEFITQIVGEVDPITHGIIFELLIELIYNSEVFSAGEELGEIIADCYPVLNVMIDRITRVAHSAGGNKCASLHPAIQLYASGEKLQFVINSVEKHVDKTSAIVRHLHAIAIAYSESKAAEIALRFLMTTSYEKPDLLHVLMAYLQCTVPFYPKLMDHMWQEYEGLRILIEQNFSGEDRKKQEKKTIHKNLLRNIRILLDWEFHDGYTADGNTYSFWHLYPGEHLGLILNSLLSESNEICWELIEKKKTEEVLNVYRLVTMLLETIRQSTSNIWEEKPIQNRRRVNLTVAEMYRMMAVLAVMLKITLGLVRKDNPEGIVIFEELRSKALYFMFGAHMDQKLSKFSPLFLNFFVTACFVDSKKLFNERIGETMQMMIDESRIVDMEQLEEGPSILEGLRSLKMRDSAVDMLHKGQLKRRRKEDPVDGDEEEDARQRVHVILDVINMMCNSGIATITLACGKQLALALVQSICKDSLMMDMRFDDWEAEAEYIHRHVEITQRLDQSRLCDGLLRILADTKSFGYCLPIMKSKLAILLNETEKFPEHKSIPEPVRLRLHNWIVLAKKGGLLPQRFTHICDLEQFATCHETHLMLVEVWRFFMFRNITNEMVDTYHNELLRNQIDAGLPNELEAIEKTNVSVFRIIIQNHLPATVPLFPLFFPLEYEEFKVARME
uniref:Fanconi anemia group I protein n=1 Tax=Caenorhabditis tropicalis TaxID=1561998 RepID=A0A1I7UMD5_9PELO